MLRLGMPVGRRARPGRPPSAKMKEKKKPPRREEMRRSA